MNDTIAAISTPFGRGGIGIIRLSGEKAFEIADRVFRGKRPVGQMKSHTIHYGKIVEPATGEGIDEVLLSVMKAPATFTRENVVEINCHGGTVVLIKIMDLLLKEGAVPAQPGEFTRRAFMNGRLDLSQAEAVIDIINAKTSESSRAAVDQLEGKLSARIKKTRGRLIELIAHIEVTIDYPENETEELTGRQVYEETQDIIRLLEEVISGFDRGRVIREGISAVIAGKPNVGKSSLLNELSGKNRAIVTDIPGTTRDIIEEYIDLKGIPVRVLDTAGIRETSDPVERIGVEKAEKALENADLVIMMLDASTGMDEEDAKILRGVAGKKVIYLINKIDAAGEKDVDRLAASLGNGKVIKASILNGNGINELENAVADLFLKGGIEANNEILLTNIRHKKLADQAIRSLRDAVAAYEGGMPLDFITIDIRNAADSLGQITGESVSEDVVQEIFSRFCVGK